MTPAPPLTDDALAALAHQARQALPDAPPAWLHAAVALWQSAPATAPLAGALRQLVAVLRFDSWAAPAQALGMRGSADDSRHLLFSAEGHDVDLRIQRQAGGGWCLSGQVLGPDETGQILLQPADGQAGQRRASLDGMGEFHLDGVGPGRWRLSLETADTLVLLPDIQVGGPSAA
jgi:hypothetical protein